ncbi:MAG TPA: rhomboid family intramembrane serine protease [Vicinamibacterales bacterium]|nr:rhomboid family intramembrane serine protease [Vicinamibacterales bacterium]
MPRGPRLSSVAYSFGPGPLTPAVRALLYSNIAVYFVSLFYDRLYDWFGLMPKLVVENRWLWQPVTYMFLHARNPTHILFNMLILWMFGVELERMWRTRFFVKYYFVTGVGAGLISVLASLLPFAATRGTYDATIVGASGALYGLLLAFALYYPNRPILMFLLFPVPAKYFVAILGAIAFLMSVQGNGPVAATTHLGGLLVGYLYLRGGRGGWTAELKYRYLKWKMNRMRRKFDVYSGGRSERSGWDRHVH